jgi:hypothetical protein
MKLRIAIAAAAVMAALAPAVADAATIEERLVKLERQNQAQARRIHSLERVTANQNAKLNWFEQCTPGPLDIGLFLDEELGNRFNAVSQALSLPAVAWQPLQAPIGAMTFALQVHPSCIHGSVSGFPW